MRKRWLYKERCALCIVPTQVVFFPYCEILRRSRVFIGRELLQHIAIRRGHSKSGGNRTLSGAPGFRAQSHLKYHDCSLACVDTTATKIVYDISEAAGVHPACISCGSRARLSEWRENVRCHQEFTRLYTGGAVYSGTVALLSISRHHGRLPTCAHELATISRRVRSRMCSRTKRHRAMHEERKTRA